MSHDKYKAKENAYRFIEFLTKNGIYYKYLDYFKSKRIGYNYREYWEYPLTLKDFLLQCKRGRYLYDAFNWGKTIEQFQYWSDINRKWLNLY